MSDDPKTKSTVKVEMVEAEVVTEQKKTPVTKKVSNNGDSSESADILAIVSLVLSVFNLCSWLITVCGCPMNIGAIVCGILGLKSEKNKTFAVIALVVSGISLFVTIVVAFGRFLATF